MANQEPNGFWSIHSVDFWKNPSDNVLKWWTMDWRAFFSIDQSGMLADSGNSFLLQFWIVHENIVSNCGSIVPAVDFLQQY